MTVSGSTPPPRPSPPLDDDVWTDAAAFSPTTDMYASASASASVSALSSVPSAPSVSSPLSLHTASDDNDAASIALRRQRNRDSMRRTRLRAKETLTELRDTVATLEAQYAQLVITPHADAQFVERLQTRLLALVQLRRTLESENGAVRAQIQQRQALEHELQELLATNALDDMVNEKLLLLGGAAAAAARDCFTPLTTAQAHATVRSFCDDLARVHAMEEVEVETTTPSLEVFGWCTRRHVDPLTNEMHFEFTKRFDHLSARDLLQRSWTQAMDVATYRAAERELNIRRLDFLQHISSDLKVLVRETIHPDDGTVFRTHYLVFRMPMPHGLGLPTDGFLVGMKSVNPPPPEVGDTDSTAERVVWIDVSVSIELRPLADAHGCHLSWRGRTNYKSPQYAAENAVKFLMGLLRWEQAIVGPLIQLY